MSANEQTFSQLPVVVVPRASRSEIVGWHEGRLKVRLKAPPVDGEANAELVRALAKLLGLGRSAVTLHSGQTSKRKLLHIDGLSQSALHARIDELLASR